MSPADIANELWNYCHVLRDDGMYVEQLTYLCSSGWPTRKYMAVS
jgi:hypothetical protein